MLNLTIGVVIILILSTIILFVRAKEKFTKLLLSNYLSTLIILAIASISLTPYRQSYIDIAYIYIFLSFIGNLGFLQYFIDKKNNETNNE